MVFGDVSDPGRYAADILNEPVSRWCSRLYWPLALSTLALPAALGYVVGGGATAASCLVWAGFARIAAIQHFTWAIASFGHRFGDQLPEAKDEARDNLVLAILLFGEGLHSYHHLNPSLAVNQPESLDLNGKILRYCERRGWIWDLKCEPEPARASSDARRSVPGP